ncbi:hypothetical protein KIPB_007625, partial [Kipferlia bialata]
FWEQSRLNVALSRAKARLVVVTDIAERDISERKIPMPEGEKATVGELSPSDTESVRHMDAAELSAKSALRTLFKRLE